MNRVAVLALVLGLLGVELTAQAINVDRAKVTVEKRQGRDWCVLDARVSGTVPVSLERVRAVIEAYSHYPKLFPEIRSASALEEDGAVLLSETVVVEAMGISNVNRFTLRVVAQLAADGRSWRSNWTQHATDGSIDSLEGGWSLESVGTESQPQTRVTYRTRSAVPLRIPGQDLVVGLFLGSTIKAVVEAVFKEALSR